MYCPNSKNDLKSQKALWLNRHVNMYYYISFELNNLEGHRVPDTASRLWKVPRNYLLGTQRWCPILNPQARRVFVVDGPFIETWQSFSAPFWGHLIQEQKSELLQPHSGLLSGRLSLSFEPSSTSPSWKKQIMKREANMGLRHCYKHKPITLSCHSKTERWSLNCNVVSPFFLKKKKKKV